MGFELHNVAFDCADAYELAQFWSKLMDKPMSDEDSPGDPESSVQLGPSFNLWFNQVPEPKTMKNRVHVCLVPDVPREEAVERALSLGASIVDDHRRPDGGGWVVFADPEGNEFCVLRSWAERHP